MKAKIILGLTAFAFSSLPLMTKANSGDTTGIGNALVGPLFYTPLERDAIDRGGIPADSNGESTATSSQPPPAILRFDGRVERSAGRTTAWVSGRPLERAQSGLPETRLRLQGERLRIETPRSTRWLKAGEQFERDQPAARESNDTVQPR